MPPRFLIAVVFLTIMPIMAMTGCARQGSDAAAAKATPGKHEHKAPHGGTAIVLGNEAYHVELVRDAASGSLKAYILDGEMERFIRSAASSFDIVASVNGAPQTLTLKAVADSATGEAVGDTSLFEAQADWLKTAAQFDAVLKSIAIRGTTFADVKFNFPKGNDKD